MRLPPPHFDFQAGWKPNFFKASARWSSTKQLRCFSNWDWQQGTLLAASPLTVMILEPPPALLCLPLDITRAKGA
jgi:hypothetical protein